MTCSFKQDHAIKRLNTHSLHFHPSRRSVPHDLILHRRHHFSLLSACRIPSDFLFKFNFLTPNTSNILPRYIHMDDEGLAFMIRTRPTLARLHFAEPMGRQSPSPILSYTPVPSFIFDAYVGVRHDALASP